ncbi:MAG: O-methyltransferase [Jatrophihabitans sp.]
MYDSTAAWEQVDRYFADTLIVEDATLVQARASGRQSSMPQAEVAANQGQLLSMLARMVGARRVLEFGTLAGYSTIWLARAVGAGGQVTTLELDERNASIARTNLAAAQVLDRVDVRVGPALDSARGLIQSGVAPYDLVFIDADKPSNPGYLAAAMELTRAGSVIVIDNVVRNGAVIDPASADDRVRGVRAVLADIAADHRLEATALQTVGSKGWDGFAIARRIE